MESRTTTLNPIRAFYLTFSLSSLLSFGLTPCLAQSDIIAEGATLVQVAADYTFTEGPAVDPQGNVYFTDQPNDKIYKWSADGGVALFMEGGKRSNGLYFDNQGQLLSCADLDNELVRIDQDQNISVLVSDYQGKRLNGPNDLWVDAGGGIYFTDPFYKRDWWDHSEKEIPDERVYYRDPDGEVTMVADGLVKPNGIVGTPQWQVAVCGRYKGFKDLLLQNKQGWLFIKSQIVC